MASRLYMLFALHLALGSAVPPSTQNCQQSSQTCQSAYGNSLLQSQTHLQRVRLAAEAGEATAHHITAPNNEDETTMKHASNFSSLLKDHPDVPLAAFLGKTHGKDC